MKRFDPCVSLFICNCFFQKAQVAKYLPALAKLNLDFRIHNSLYISRPHIPPGPLNPQTPSELCFRRKNICGKVHETSTPVNFCVPDIRYIVCRLSLKTKKYTFPLISRVGVESVNFLMNVKVKMTDVR